MHMSYSEACQWLNLDPNPNNILDESILKIAFRKAAMKEHPDKSTCPNATERFQAVTHAHEYLVKCVMARRGGANHEDYSFQEENDDDDLYDEEEAYYKDLYARIFVFFGPGGTSMRFSFGGGGSSSPNEDDQYEEYMERLHQKNRERKAERQRKIREREETLRRQRQHAMEEGRDFFEAWGVKQLQQEATKRGIRNIQGLQQQSLAELLIEDETKKRLRRELKERAPLVEEWCQVVGLETQQCWNGRKVNVTDFYDDRYMVEWEDPSSKKKSQQHRHMYPTSKKARLKPENLELWGTKVETTASSSKDNVMHPPATNNKKSRKERRKEAIPAKEAQARNNTSSQSKVADGHKPDEEPFPDQPASPPSTVDQFERPSKDLEELIQQATTDTTKCIQHKVKCPMDKRPGDLLAFANPHIPATKQTVRIPQDAKPGKFFKVMVPLPVVKTMVHRCCVCTNEFPEGTDNNSIVLLPLRSCAHTSCIACLPSIQGRACPICASPLPTIDSLNHLPHVQLFNSDAVKQALLGEFFVLKESHRDGKKQTQLEEAAQAVVKSIDKYYRRASIKLHPDRHGELFRQEFDQLTKARDVLREDKLRRSYVSDMLEIVCKIDSGYIPQSHQSWVNRHDPDAQQDPSRPKTRQAGKKETPLALDGGLAFSSYKRPRVFVVNDKSRQVKVYLPLKGAHQFLEYCTSVTICGSCGNVEEDEIMLAKISKSKFDVVDYTEIRHSLCLPAFGIWDIYWCATFEMDGQFRTTPHSGEVRVDLRTEAQRAFVSQKDAINALAHRRTAEVQSVLRTYKLKTPTDRHQVEERYSTLHPVVAKGSDVRLKLIKLYQSLGDALPPALTTLEGALSEAKIVKAELEDSLASYGKRDQRREFQRFVADQQERGEAEGWMSSVTKEELECLGGDSNRFFQLLIEGKKANALAFNDTTLAAAENRVDLFTTKQCKTLKARKEAVEACYTAELENAATEAKQKEEEESKRRQLEEQAKAIRMQRGTKVKLQGLKSSPELINLLGTYMGLGHGGRYIVKLDHDGREISLKKENFREYNFSDLPPKTWSCLSCTLLHDGELASLTQCSVCDTPKGSTSNLTSQKTDAHVSSKAPELEDTANKKREPKPAIQKPRRGKREKKDLSETTAKISALDTKILHGNASAKTKPKDNSHLTTKITLVSKADKVDPHLSHVTDEPKIVRSRCRFGAKCRDLKRRAEACQFYHPPEEIALCHPKHPSDIAFSVVQGDSAEVPAPKVDGNSIKSSASSKVGRKTARCMNLLDCRKLKKSPTTCPFYHPPDEIAVYHPNAILTDNPSTLFYFSSDGQRQTEHEERSSTSSKSKKMKGKKTKKTVQCMYGLQCHKLKESPTSCPFYHPRDHIAKYHPSSAKRSAEKPILRDNASAFLENDSQVKRVVMLESNAVGHVVGKGKKGLGCIVRTSGAKVVVSKEADSHGLFAVTISGTENAVAEAANLVTDAALKSSISTEEISLLSGLSWDETFLAPDNARSVNTKVSSSPNEAPLLLFVKEHKNCFKCSPNEFYLWLCSQDMCSLSDLAEACEDEEFVVNDMQANGLKGFKRRPFIKAVNAATGA